VIMRILLLSLVSLAMMAGEADPPPLVYVPYDRIDTTDPGTRSVWLPYARFLELWERAQGDAGGRDPQPPVAAALDVVTFTGAIVGDVAELRVDGVATGLAKAWSTVELPPGLALTAFAPADPKVVLERTTSALRLHLPAAGRYPFTATLLAAVVRDADGKRRLVLPVPRAGAARLDLAIAQDDAQVTVAPAVALTTVVENGGTRLMAVLGGADQVAIAWQPPVDPGSGDALILARHSIRVSAGERALRVDLALDAQVMRRALPELALTVPEGWQVLAVEAGDLKSWEVVDGRLLLRPHAPIEGRWALAVRLERELPRLDEGEQRREALPFPRLIGAARATGDVAVTAGEGVVVALERHEGLTQVDPAELPRAIAAGATAAYRFLADPPPSEIAITRLAPEVRADLHQLIRLGIDEDQAVVRIALDVRKAGVFALDVSAPGRWELVDVAGIPLDEIQPLAQPQGAGESRRSWRLTLTNRLIGHGSATLRLRAPPSIPSADAPATAPGAAIDAAPLALVGARRQTTTLVIAAPGSWALESTTRTNLTAIEAQTALRDGPLAAHAAEVKGDETATLAFSGIDAAAAVLALSATRRQREITVAHEELLTLAEGQWKRVVTWRGEVRYAGASTLAVRAPTALRERLVFKHPGLAERVAVDDAASGMTTWELRFQNPLLGAFTLVAEAAGELPPLTAGATTAFIAEPIALATAARVRVIQAVARAGAIEVGARAAGTTDLAPADLPAALQGEGVVAGFQSSQPARIEATLVRHDLVALADASVGAARYTVVVGDDGLARVKALLDVANRGRPYLALRLPDGAKLLEIAVGGRQVRASRDADGRVLIDLEERSGAQSVAYVYEQRLADGLGAGGAITLRLPSIVGDDPAVPVERSEVTVWLPEDLASVGVSGDLRPVERVDAVAADGDGLSIRLTPSGRARLLHRLGDGGSITLRYLDHDWLRALALLGGITAAAAVAALRRRIGIVSGIVLALAALWLLASGPLREVAAAGMVGAVAAAVVVVALRAWHARRAAASVAGLAPVTDPWLESAPPADPSRPPAPPRDGDRP